MSKATQREAQRITEADVATVEATGLQTTDPVGSTVPAYIKTGDTRGSENIGKDDIVFPAFKLAQDTTPEAKRADPAYVKGLASGMFFNSVTKDNYGEGPIDLVVVNALGHRHIEFAPFDEGGGVVDFNVPDGDPRTLFHDVETDGVKKRVKPVATTFYDYLVIALLPTGPLLMTMSLKSTQIKKAKIFNSRLFELGKKGIATFAQRFSARPKPETKGGQTFYGWQIEPAGWTDQAVYEAAEKAYTAFAGKDIAAKIARTEERDADEEM